MADKNIKSTSVKATGRVPQNRGAIRPVSGVQYANPYAVRYNAGMAGMPRRAPAQRKSAPPPPVKKNKRKERDYFFIMRRGVCFLMLLHAIVWVAAIFLDKTVAK